MSLVKREYDLPVGDLELFKPDTVYGYARFHGMEKPIYSCREISKGPDKGRFECVYLKKVKKYATVRLSKNQIRFLETPWTKKKKSKLVKRQ